MEHIHSTTIFLLTNSELYVNCIQGHKRVCYSIDTQTPNVCNWLDSTFPSVEYVGMAWETKIFRVSGPDCPPTLCYYEEDHFVAVNEKEQMGLFKAPFASMLTWSVFNSSDENPCECLLYEPASHSATLSLIVLLHGGPHNTFAALYTPDILYYVHHGFAVLVPNYHGSFGYGDAFLHSLHGHIGEVDVQDVLNAISTTLAKRPTIDPDSIIVLGSSYGGFLGMRLLEASPSLFKYAIIRNGVLDTVAMMTSSDMAFWMLVLAGVISSRDVPTEKVRQVLEGSYIYSIDDLKAVQAVNPIQSLAEVQTPICFILGGRDCRVINQQSLEAYRILKGLGRDVEILINGDDDHFLRTALSRKITCAKVYDWKNKNDNCRIRTCAGNAQQISSLSP